jgi:hypothetical protein
LSNFAGSLRVGGYFPHKNKKDINTKVFKAFREIARRLAYEPNGGRHKTMRWNMLEPKFASALRTLVFMMDKLSQTEKTCGL